MSEWASVLAVFWVLWAIDGARFGPRRLFTVVGGWRARRGRFVYGRLSLPGFSPGSWRLTFGDPPLALSPAGVCNLPVGSMGRPPEAPVQVQAWRWEEVREIGVAKGWIYVNGRKFCADTGHVTAPELLALAKLEQSARERRIKTIVRRWFRPMHLRRRARVLAARTQVPAVLNLIVLIGLVAVTVYVAGNFAERLPLRTGRAIAHALPWVLGELLVLHMAAVIWGWRAVRRLRPITKQSRNSTLFSALMLPPQALRVRSILGDGFFPPQHPIAAAVAFGRKRALARNGFATLADLRWPLPLPGSDVPLVREITGWFRELIEPRIVKLLAKEEVKAVDLLKPPRPDGNGSCSYCPRCGDQFVGGAQTCPHGIALVPLDPRRGV